MYTVCVCVWVCVCVYVSVAVILRYSGVKKSLIEVTRKTLTVYLSFSNDWTDSFIMKSEIWKQCTTRPSDGYENNINFYKIYNKKTD